MTLQEGVKAVGGVVEALKSQPMVLALVIMNMALLAILYYGISVSTASRRHEFELMVGNQRDAREKQAEIKDELDQIKQKVLH